MIPLCFYLLFYKCIFVLRPSPQYKVIHTVLFIGNDRLIRFKPGQTPFKL